MAHFLILFVRPRRNVFPWAMYYTRSERKTRKSILELSLPMTTILQQLSKNYIFIKGTKSDGNADQRVRSNIQGFINKVIRIIMSQLNNIAKGFHLLSLH